MSDKGFAVFYGSADEFAIEEQSKIDADSFGASAWFPTFTEAKKWSIEAVKHNADGYRNLLKAVRRMKKSEVA